MWNTPRATLNHLLQSLMIKSVRRMFSRFYRQTRTLTLMHVSYFLIKNCHMSHCQCQSKFVSGSHIVYYDSDNVAMKTSKPVKNLRTMKKYQ